MKRRTLKHVEEKKVVEPVDYASKPDLILIGYANERGIDIQPEWGRDLLIVALQEHDADAG